MEKTREAVMDAIRVARVQSGRAYLTYKDFRAITGIPMSWILKHFDLWSEACVAAGVTPGTASPTNITPNRSRGTDHALAEVRRVAKLLHAEALSKAEFDSQSPAVKACTVARLCGGWAKALEDAGVGSSEFYRRPVPLRDLADEFLAAFLDIGSVPNLRQLIRRSGRNEKTLSRKWGGYPAFKRLAIADILAREGVGSDAKAVLQAHLADLTSPTQEPQQEPRPHSQGRHLGFRAFAFAPTYEQEVVSLFSCVAWELGFEIVAQRPAFPDCEARRVTDSRRKRYAKCLIEFEFRSRDYVAHKHPLNGCDLIVCWEHNWEDCPIEVLDLSTAIRKLDGWR